MSKITELISERDIQSGNNCFICVKNVVQEVFKIH